MNLLTALANTVRLIGLIIRQGARGAYLVIAPQVRPYIISLLIVAGSAFVLTLALIIAKVVGGFVWCGYAATFLAAIFTFALGLLWAPVSIIIGLTLGETEDLKIREAGERYVRFVGVLFFNELLFSLYLIVFPFHNNLGLLPPLIILGVMFLLGSMIWGGWLSGKFITQAAFYSFLILSISMFLPESRNAVAEKAGSIDKGLASFVRDDSDTPNSAESAGVGKIKSEKVLPYDIAPDKWTSVTLPQWVDFRVERPGKIEYLFPNGKHIVAEAGDNVSFGKLPSRSFKIRGDAGKVKFIVRHQ